jgi:hypothetical protein
MTQNKSGVNPAHALIQRRSVGKKERCWEYWKVKGALGLNEVRAAP